MCIFFNIQEITTKGENHHMYFSQWRAAALQTAVMEVVSSGVGGEHQESAILHRSFRFGLDRQAQKHVSGTASQNQKHHTETAAQRGNWMRGLKASSLSANQF